MYLFLVILFMMVNKYLTKPSQCGININMDAFIHTFIAVGSLAAFYYAGQFFAKKTAAEEAVDLLLGMLERDGFIKTTKDHDGESELIPISEIVSKALRDAKV